MKNWKFKLIRTLNLAIILEMVLLPFQGVHAQNIQDNVLNKGAQGLKFASEVLNETSRAYQQAQQLQAQKAQSGLSPEEQQQLFNALRLKPRNPNDVPNIFTRPIVGDNGVVGAQRSQGRKSFDNIRQKCVIAQPRLDGTSSGLKCEELSSEDIAAGYLNVIVDASEANLNDLNNLLTEGGSEGISCLDKGINDLLASLDEREEELTAVENRIKESIDAFQKASEEDLQKVKQNTALLEGQPAELLKDAEFATPFKDPQCASFINETEITDTGKSTGLRGIEDLLQQRKSAKENGGLSAVEMDNNRYKQLEKEIRKVSKKLANRSSLNNGIESLTPQLNSISINNSVFGKNNTAIANALSNFNIELNQKLEDVRNKYDIEGISSNEQLAGFISNINRGQSNLNTRLERFERNTKNSCLQENLASLGSASGFAAKFKDPQISAAANRDADSSLKNFIEETLSNNSLTIEEKLALIEEEEQKGSNKRFIMKTGKSFKIKGRTISASTPLRPSQILGFFTENCEDKFDTEKSFGTYSAKEALDNIKKYQSELNSIASSNANAIQSSIETQLLNCPDRTSEPQSANGCIGALNTNSEGFCLENAKTCASNIRACTEKAEDAVNSVVTERKKYVDNYNTQFDAFKEKLGQDLNVFNQFMVDRAKQFEDALELSEGFNLPKLSFDTLKKDDRLLNEAGVPSELEIEDPQKYFELIQGQLAQMRASLAEQNAVAEAKAQEEKNKIVASWENEQRRMQNVIDTCRTALRNFNTQESERISKQNERTQEINQVCAELEALNKSPKDSCGVPGSLADDIAKIVAETPNRTSSDTETLAFIRNVDSSCNSNDKAPEVSIAEVDFSDVYNRCQASSSPECLAIKTAKKPCGASDLQRSKTICLKKEVKTISLVDSAEDCRNLGAEGEYTVLNGLAELKGSKAINVSEQLQCSLVEGNSNLESNYKKVAQTLKTRAQVAQISNSQGELRLSACGNGFDGEFAFGKGLSIQDTLDFDRGVAAQNDI